MEASNTKLDDSEREVLTARAQRIWKAAERLAERLANGSALTSHALRRAMNDQTADGGYPGHHWNWRDAYDAAEIAVNLRVLKASAGTTSAAESGRRAIAAALGLAQLEPPQTQRQQATDGLQQFSTPIEIAIAVIEAADIRAHDRVLEPSAGTGVLAMLAAAHLDPQRYGRLRIDEIDQKRCGHLRVNEIDPQRAMLLRKLFGDRAVGENDAETLREKYEDLQPSVIVMNPPFTTRRSDGTMRRNADLAHLAAACRLAAPNRGRVVAVTSCNCEPGNERWNKAFDSIELTPAVRASIVIDGGMFRSRGIKAHTRLTIIDVEGDGTGPMVSATADNGRALRAIVREAAAARRAA